MSKSVVTAAAAAAHAKGVVQKNTLAKRGKASKPTQDDQQTADHKDDAANAVQADSELQHQTSMADTTLGGFSFAGALATAASSAAALTTEVAVQGDGGSDGEGDGSGTVLLIGAVALVGGGIAALASGGGGDDVDANPNTAPVLADIAAQTTDEDTAKTFSFTAATDADGDTVTYSLGTVTGGTATISGTSITFTPTANFNGAASVVVNAADGKGGTASKTAAITVAAVNDAPALADIAAQTTDEDVAKTFNVSGSDVDSGTTLTYTIGAVTGGTATVTSAGAVTFTPTANFNGAASVAVTVSDGTLTATKTAAITVNPVNDAPVLADIAAQTTSLNTAKTFAVSATDVDGPTPLVFSIGTVTGGTATVANGQVTFTPTTGFTGDATVIVNVADSATPALTDNQTVTIAVSPVAGPTNQSIDVGIPTGSTPIEVNAGTGSFNFTDNANANTFVRISNFTADDHITVTGLANPADYRFTTGTGADVTDLRLEYSNPNGTATIIIFDNVLTVDDLVLGPYTGVGGAREAVGFDFMTFA